MIDLDELVLKHGSHTAPAGELHEGVIPDMCVMEAVAYVAGEPWSDRYREVFGEGLGLKPVLGLVDRLIAVTDNEEVAA